MMRGEIYKEDWMYHLVVEEDNINSLKDKIRLLEEENKKLKEKSEWVNIEELDNYKKWLNEANVAYEELEASSEKKLDDSLERCFNHMNRTRCLPVLQAPTFNEFKKWALGMDTSDTDSDFVDLPF